MLARPLPGPFPVFSLAIAIVVAAFFLGTSALSAARPVPMHVGLGDSARTLALSVGQQLVVTLPLRLYDDDNWHVVRNSGGVLKLIAGPDIRRPWNWKPGMECSQVFYFKKESPGTTNLILERSSHGSKPMILTVIDQ